MKLDPRLSATRAHQILLRRAGQTFGPARTFELNDALQYAGEALSRIAQAPLALAGFPPDLSGMDEEGVPGGALAEPASSGEASHSNDEGAGA